MVVPARFGRNTTKYLQIMRDECDLEKWKEIVRRAVLDALAGNAEARIFLASYLLVSHKWAGELDA